MKWALGEAEFLFVWPLFLPSVLVFGLQGHRAPRDFGGCRSIVGEGGSLAAAAALAFCRCHRFALYRHRQGQDVLATLAEDQDMMVHNAALSSIENVAAVLDGRSRKSVQALEEIKDRYESLNATLDVMVDNFQRATLMVQYHRYRETFDDTIYSQLPLRRAYAYLFCMDCLCRADEVVFHDWSWVRCQRCKDVFGLKPGVVQVIGMGE